METLTRERRESWPPSGVSFSQFNRMFIYLFTYFLLFLLRMNMSFSLCPVLRSLPKSNSDNGSAIIRHQRAWDEQKENSDFLREEEQGTHAGMPLDPI